MKKKEFGKEREMEAERVKFKKEIFKEKEKELICMTEIPISKTAIRVSSAQRGAKRSFLRQALNDAVTPD